MIDDNDNELTYTNAERMFVTKRLKYHKKLTKFRNEKNILELEKKIIRL